MPDSIKELRVADGDRVATEHIRLAVAGAELVYEDGATQTFGEDGATTYVENGSPTVGEWYIEDGRFWSYWPPSYRASYELTWLVEAGEITGLRFNETERGSRSVGHYRES